MVTLDNLVVTNALVSIRDDLGASLEELEWTVNAYTLSFAVLPADRRRARRPLRAAAPVRGRHRVFTVASAAAALAPTRRRSSPPAPCRALGAAIVTPLTLTLLSEAFPRERRGLALGIWSGVPGLGVALGPVVGGAVVEGCSWQWIFWLNVPIGIVLAPLGAAPCCARAAARAGRLDVPGLGARQRRACSAWCSGSCGRKRSAGRAPTVLALASAAGSRCWPRSSPGSCAPRRRCCRCASSATAASRRRTACRSRCPSAVFGAIFLLAQFFQTAQGYSPLEAGVRTLPWTAMPMLRRPGRGHARRPDRRRAR